MKCNHCDAELFEKFAFCPHCGAQLPEEETVPLEVPEEPETEIVETVDGYEDILPEEKPAKKKIKTWKIILACVGGVLLLLALAVGVAYHFFSVDFGINDAPVMKRDSYSVEDAVALEKGDVVIATVGNRELTNGQLQIYYWSGVSDFLNYYSSYLTALGIDYTKPFDEQIFNPDTGMTYQQMFLENALDSWRRYATLMMLAEEADFKLSDEEQKTVDGFANQVTAMAEYYGYDDVAQFLQEQMAPGTTLDGYLAYLHENYVGMAYYDTLFEAMMPSDTEVEAYFEEHKAEFEENDITKESGLYYDVRHILIPIEGGTKDENGTTIYSDQDWTDCQKKAQDLLDEFLAGDATEEVFGELAAEYSTDGGSSSNGGLYTQLTKDTNFVEGFKNWYLEEGRKPGDTGLVQSLYGYHIMYFSQSYEIWKYEAQSMLLSDMTSKMLEDAMEKWPMDVNYKKIVLGMATPSAS
ncbi:MAG: peptidylprolyl isomerase [Oscillospiraceae bacterium]|nr:peptidylprolyl isomerase [Oscillospiraceae bacterium]